MALDVDGVLFPLIDPRDPQVPAEKTGWEYLTVENGVYPHAQVAEPVLQTLYEMGAGSGVRTRTSGSRSLWRALLLTVRRRFTRLRGCLEAPPRSDVTILWHTSHGADAPRLIAPALGCDRLMSPASVFPSARTDLAGSRPTSGISSTSPQSGWWKLDAVRAWLDSHPLDNDLVDRLIWIDDDIEYAMRTGEIDEELLSDPRLIMISPDHRIGISPLELSTLRSLINLP